MKGHPYFDLLEINQKFQKESCYPLITGYGDTDKQIMIIQFNITKKEETLGKIITSTEGYILKEMLENINVKRKEVYTTSIIKYVKNNQEQETESIENYTEEELKQAKEFLEQEIKAIKPKIIISLGEEALKFIFPKLTLKTAQGKYYLREGTKVFPIEHPNKLVEDIKAREETKNIIKKIKEHL